MNSTNTSSHSKIAHWHGGFTKKYQLSLKRHGYKTEGNQNTNNKVKSSSRKLEESAKDPMSESQNFVLRLSEGSTIEDHISDKDTKGNNEIIVISDSSFNSTFDCIKKQTYQVKKPIPENKIIDKAENATKSSGIYVVESSDTDSEEGLFLAWSNKINKDIPCNKNSVNINPIRKNGSLFTSDESSDSDMCNKNVKSSSKSDNTHDRSPQSTHHSRKELSVKSTAKENNIFTKFHTEQKSDSTSSCSSSSYNKSKHISEKSKGSVYRDSPRNYSNLKTKLTKKVTYDILKNLRSTRNVYESPREKQETNVIIDESVDEDIHPAISPKGVGKGKTDRENNIDEEKDTVNKNPDSKDEIDNSFDDSNSRPASAAKDKMYVDLSERKKKLISQWLMTTSPKSDSSYSHISPSNRNSVSGNSSLERLEMNYETPNNRGKIHKINDNEKRKNTLNQDNTDYPVQHTLINKIVEETKDTNNQFCTPITSLPSPKADHIPSSTSGTPRGVIECADILDKLYGNEWRAKADTVLAVSEPRKPKPIKPRAVQTEKKLTSKIRNCSTDSEDDDSDNFLQNIKPYDFKKKSQTKHRKPRDEFINDESSSGSDSIYHTALTNPNIFNRNSRRKPTSVSLTTRRAITICDSDTESDTNNTEYNKYLNKKRLSFSEEEDGTSGTSEFDPGDFVPPKVVSKKDLTKVSSEILKTKDYKDKNHPSFLASLSDTVPLANAHPDAKKYRLNYKNNRDELCKHLFKLYNEKVFDKQLPEDMSIEWNVRMRGTAGFCYNKKSVRTLGRIVKSSRIVLATKILDTPDRVRDTLIHEMCHAAAWVINDVSNGHGSFWQAWASKAMKVFPELPAIRRCHNYKIKTKFTYKCMGCGYSIGRHSKSLDVERKRCGYCYGKFELFVNKTDKSGTVVQQTPKREPSGFALYVKENYSTIKKERNAKHAEIMKILGQQFSALKIAKKNICENNSDTLV